MESCEFRDNNKMIMDETTDTAATPLQKAVLALQLSTQKCAKLEAQLREPIAIVGIGCRFPLAADSPQRLWEQMVQQVDCITEAAEDRWRVSDLPTGDGGVYVNKGGFLLDVGGFDASFFGISPAEARSLDPQQRICLEVAWHALEDANINPDHLRKSKTGVFIGATKNEYFEHVMQEVDAHEMTGSALNFIAGRIAYAFDLAGPAIVVDTACSSSLTAIHLACQSLRSAECSLALAGGVNVVLSPRSQLALCKAGMLSRDGLCKTFDEKADGMVRGEGGGVIVLKRLSDAIRDGNRIYAAIRASAINQNGTGNSITAPNGESQSELMRATLRTGGMNAADVQYVEAHGTGTALGDPIELNAICNVYGSERNPGECLWIGSGKPQLGHGESVAGVSGLIRAVLMMNHGKLIPNAHLSVLTPKFDWLSHPVIVPAAITEWPTKNGRRVAAISSFGASGTNAHLILEAHCDESKALGLAVSLPASGVPHVLCLSAKTEETLRDVAAEYVRLLEKDGGISLSNLCYTANSSRARLRYRVALLAHARDEMLRKLQEVTGQPAADAGPMRVDQTGRKPVICIVFSGQGGLNFGAIGSIYKTCAPLREIVDQCAIVFRKHYPEGIERYFGNEVFALLAAKPEVVQPLLFISQVALFHLLSSMGVKADIVLGHSLGEYAAAYVAGIISVDDALELVISRASLMAALPRTGKMVAMACSAQDIEPFTRAHRNVGIAAVNSDRSVVISGDDDAVDAVVRESGVAAQRLNVTHAFHSPLMRSALPAFEECLKKAVLRKPDSQKLVISTLTGRKIDEELTDISHWSRHIHAPVLFKDAIEEAHQTFGADVFVELGVGAGLARHIIKTTKSNAIAVEICAASDPSGWRSLLGGIGELYCHNVNIQWDSIYPGVSRQLLPLYPFRRLKYWPLQVESRGSVMAGAIRPMPAMCASHLVDIEIDLRGRHRYLLDHAINGRVVLPAAFAIEMYRQAAERLGFVDAFALSDVSFSRLVPLEPSSIARIGASYEAKADGEIWVTLKVCFDAADPSLKKAADWFECSRAVLWSNRKTPIRRHDSAGTHARSDRGVGPEVTDAVEFYESLQRRRAEFGRAFRLITSIKKDRSSTLVTLEIYDAIDESARFVTAIDACMQAIGVCWSGEQNSAAIIPVSIREFEVYGSIPMGRLYVEVRMNASGGFELELLDERGTILAVFSSFAVKELGLPGSLGTEVQHPVMHLRWSAKEDGHSPAPVIGVDNEPPYLLLGEMVPLDLERPASFRILSPAELKDIASNPGSSGAGAVSVIYPVCFGVVDDFQATDAIAALTALTKELRQLLQLLSRMATHRSIRLHVMTRHAAKISDTDLVNPVAAAAFALIATAAKEFPELEVFRIDTDSFDSSTIVLAQEENGCALIGIRQTRCYHARWKYIPDLWRRKSSADCFSLKSGAGGSLGNIKEVPLSRRIPARDEVEVLVRYVSLNFKDVLHALNVLGEEDSDAVIGFEAAGTVAAFGEGVSDLEIGDPVLVFDRGAASRYLTLPKHKVLPLPATVTPAEAAALPVASLTVFYAFHQLCSLSKNQRVLIHSAAGGVGLAAVDFAHSVGAHVYATASVEKWELLRGFGVSHIWNSRAPNYASEIRALSSGTGVDVVLNSLSGDHRAESLRALKEGGVFIELGKIGAEDVRTLLKDRKDVRYFHFDIGELWDRQPSYVRHLFEQLIDMHEQGRLRAPLISIHEREEVGGAMRALAQGRTTGKVVIDLEGRKPALLRSDRAYLIAGGTGALGKTTAKVMVQEGAKHIVVCARNAEKTSSAEYVKSLGLPDTQCHGVHIYLVSIDMADPKEVDRLRRVLEKDVPPLSGVIHAAGQLSDGMLDSFREEEFGKTLVSKIGVALNLLSIAKGQSLDFFILYSSIASAFGSAGQAEYSLANGYLDGLAESAAQAGSSLKCINWGPWSKGMAALLDNALKDRVERLGLYPINDQEGEQLISEFLAAPAGRYVAARMDGVEFARHLPNNERSLFIVPRARHTDDSLKEVFEKALRRQPDEARAWLTHTVMGILRRVLALPEDALMESDARLFSLGLDSLLSVEFRNVLQKSFFISLPSTLALEYPTPGSIAAFLYDSLNGMPDNELKPRRNDVEVIRVENFSDLEQYSDEDLKRLLLAECETLDTSAASSLN